MSLRIIGAGMGRTGTHSLKLALEQLGFGPCHHMYEIRESPEQLALWQGIARGETPDWSHIFSNYIAQVDWPGARYWKEISTAFPSAKVILTHRPPEEWYASFSETIVRANTIGSIKDPNPHTRAMAQLLEHIIFKDVFDGRVADKDHAIRVYNDHLDQVQACIPKDRLLVFNVKEGWEPLCRFLGIAAPTVDFPQTNSKKDFLDRKTFLHTLESP